MAYKVKDIYGTDYTLDDYIKKDGFQPAVILQGENGFREISDFNKKYKNSPTVYLKGSSSSVNSKMISNYKVDGQPIYVESIETYPVFNDYIEYIFPFEYDPQWNTTDPSIFYKINYTGQRFEIYSSEGTTDGSEYHLVSQSALSPVNSCFVELQAQGGSSRGGTAVLSRSGGGSGGYFAQLMHKFGNWFPFIDGISFGHYISANLWNYSEYRSEVNVFSGYDGTENGPGAGGVVEIRSGSAPGAIIVNGMPGQKDGSGGNSVSQPRNVSRYNMINLRRGGYTAFSKSLYSGCGGSSMFAPGGNGVGSGQNGIAGQLGSGASGGASKAFGSTQGANGGNGFIRIWYYNPELDRVKWEEGKSKDMEIALIDEEAINLDTNNNKKEEI